MGFKKIFKAKGHLIDSGTLSNILNMVMNDGGDYEVMKFEIGKENGEHSTLKIAVSAPSEQTLYNIEKKIIQMGCYEATAPNALLKEAPKDKCVPDDFYSTTNHRTEVFYNDQWIKVAKQRMDAVIVIKEDGSAECKKLRDIVKGEQIVCSPKSIRVFPPDVEDGGSAFGFMENEVSSERSVNLIVKSLAEELKEIKKRNGKIVVVAGPVVIHTGASPALSALIRDGYIHGLLSGNALAVHDIETFYCNTSLGVDMNTGKPTYEGHKNHMRAINWINYHGSIKAAVEAGALTDGLMYQVTKSEIPYCLAGSIRDDGPLPETVTDMIDAQSEYAKIIEGADIVFMLSSMLHSIGTGNMMPSWVKTICIDINPAVVTKLSDRGSSQAIGIVSDVGLFMQALAKEVGSL